MKAESWNPLLKSYPDSDKINAVSIGAETLYTRLVAQSDDEGHYYGEAKWILPKLFTARMLSGQVSIKEVDGWLAELSQAGLIEFYDAGGQRFLELVNIKKCLRRDVKKEVRFPLRDECVTDTARTRPECVTDSGRVRNGFGPLEETQNRPIRDPDPEPEEKQSPSASPPDAKPPDVEIPLPLQTDAFRAAWHDWQKHRREKRNKITPSSAKKQLAKLAPLGSERAVAAIEHSIRQGWTGIFEDKDHGSSNRQSRTDKTGREFTESLTL